MTRDEFVEAGVDQLVRYGGPIDHLAGLLVERAQRPTPQPETYRRRHLTPAARGILAALSVDPTLSRHALCQRLGLQPQTVSNALGTLRRAGLLVRKRAA